MDFREYDKKNNSGKKSSDWIKRYDFDTCHLISEARLNKGLTQAQLAKLVGTQQPGIARAESGSVVPGHELLKKIALAIGTSLTPPKFGFMESHDVSRITIAETIRDPEEKYKLIFVGIPYSPNASKEIYTKHETVKEN